MHHKETHASTQRCSRAWHLPLLEEQWPGPEVFPPKDTFRGRYFWLYSIKEEEPLSGLPGLAHVLPIAESDPSRSPLLVPTQQELSQCGLLAVSPQTNIPLERAGMTTDTLLSARWLFAVEWISTLSAWDALLFTFDHLDPLVIGLKPTLVFPTLCVAHLAHHPHASVFETLQRWAPLLDDREERLLTLLLALYLYWLDGPSQAAQALRARSQDSDLLPEESMAIFEAELAAFEQLAGAPRLDALLHAQRFVPAVLRLLDEVSWSLWNPTLPGKQQQDAVLRAHPDLQALLAIALWHAQTLSLPKLSLKEEWSLKGLYELWQQRSAEAS